MSNWMKKHLERRRKILYFKTVDFEKRSISVRSTCRLTYDEQYNESKVATTIDVAAAKERLGHPNKNV